MTQLAPKRRLILDAAIDHASITGTLTAPSGARRVFHGWIELDTAIEALLAPDTPGEATGSSAATAPGSTAADSLDQGAE